MDFISPILLIEKKRFPEWPRNNQNDYFWLLVVNLDEAKQMHINITYVTSSLRYRIDVKAKAELTLIFVAKKLKN